MKIIFAGGGTAGHVNPAIAAANYIRARQKDAEIYFSGGKNNIEERLAEKEGYEIFLFPLSGLSRKININGIKHNITALRDASGAIKKCKEIIRRIKPDIVVGTGGYAGYPMVCAAQKCGVKTAILEPNATPGFVTKRTCAKADCVMICFPQTRDYIGKAKKIVVTGIPVRQEIMECTAHEYSPLFENKLPTVASFWGSVGAKYMNDKITEIMAMGCKNRDFNHLHGAGKNHYARMSEELSKLCDYKTADNLKLCDYIFDMDRVMAKADLIISRGGASTIAEICAAGKPSIIVPSPYVTENHQEKNARVLEKAGAAIVLTEEEATAKKLYETALALLSDKEKLAKMSANARAMSSPLALEKIYNAIMETAR